MHLILKMMPKKMHEQVIEKQRIKFLNSNTLNFDNDANYNSRTQDKKKITKTDTINEFM